MSDSKTASFGFRDVPEAEKEGLVREVFSSVAARYDLMNDVMSGGVHRIWKDAMVEWLNPQPGWRVLDVAGGTGDIAFRIAEMARQRKITTGGDEAALTVCDINADMLGEGKRRAEAKGETGIAWVCGDAEKLPFPDAQFDAYTIAFGIRNVTHIEAALREARRVLKPGGRFLCLEFSKVTVPGLDAIYDAYSFKLLPKMGAMVAGDAESYRYLAESIRRFPPPDQFARMIAEAGLDQVKIRTLSGGIAAMHSAWAHLMSDLSSLLRLWQSARLLARYDALLPSEYRARLPFSARAARMALGLGRIRENGPPGLRLAHALEHLGPAYIKLGQMLATRPDIVGEDVARTLEHLQDRLPPFPDAVARAAIAESLGHSVEDLFSAFGAPVAAASIAQVHRATTSEGAEAAVKVLRPGIEALFRRDLEALALFARLAERFSVEARRLRFIALVETLAASVSLELDLRMEAAAASELYERTRGDAEFRVPHVDWTRTSGRVLTSEWIDGVPIRDAAALRAAGHDPKKIALTLVRSFLTQALRDGFFHADMHPGNLFLDGEGRLVAVDFGIMGRLDIGMRRFMAGTLAGFLARDYRRVAQLHYDYAFVPPHHPVETFAQALRAIGEPIFGKGARDVSIARLLGQLFETTRRFDMQAQPQLVLLQKTMVVVEGVARNLDPDFDIWDAARPVAERWVSDNLGPEARLARAAEGVSALGKLAEDLPQLVRNAEQLSQMVAEGGVRLHPDTAREIAREQDRKGRPLRVALVALLTVIAAALLWRWHGFL